MFFPLAILIATAPADAWTARADTALKAGDACTAFYYRQHLATAAPGDDATVAAFQAAYQAKLLKTAGDLYAKIPAAKQAALADAKKDLDAQAAKGPLADATCAAHKADCSDFIVDDGEQCDDGNTVDGDGCSAKCMSEAPAAAAPPATTTTTATTTPATTTPATTTPATTTPATTTPATTTPATTTPVATTPVAMTPVATTPTASAKPAKVEEVNEDALPMLTTAGGIVAIVGLFVGGGGAGMAALSNSKIESPVATADDKAGAETGRVLGVAALVTGAILVIGGAATAAVGVM